MPRPALSLVCLLLLYSQGAPPGMAAPLTCDAPELGAGPGLLARIEAHPRARLRHRLAARVIVGGMLQRRSELDAARARFYNLRHDLERDRSYLSRKVTYFHKYCRGSDRWGCQILTDEMGRLGDNVESLRDELSTTELRWRAEEEALARHVEVAEAHLERLLAGLDGE